MSRALLLALLAGCSTLLAANGDRPADGSLAIRTRVSADDIAWLREATKKQLRGCRVQGKGGVWLHTPDGVGNYRALWTRDFQYMVEYAGDLLDPKEIKASFLYLLAGQRDDGCMPDRVNVAGQGVFSPGSEQKPLADHALDNGAFMAKLGCAYVDLTGDLELFRQVEPALRKGLDHTRRAANGLVYNPPDAPQCPYGFTDTVAKTGHLLFCSVLYYDACLQMERNCRQAKCGDPGEYRRRAELIRKNLGRLWNDEAGMFWAADRDCKQIDIWGSALAVDAGCATEEQADRIAVYLVEHYDQIVQHGQVRHLPAGQTWQRILAPIKPGTYQNGAFWATPVAWVAPTIARRKPELAARLVKDVIADFRERGITECVNGDYHNVPEYVVSATNIYSLLAEPSLRHHRNLYNGDFGIFFWNAEMWQPEGGRYSAKAIHRFVDRLADSGVDTFVINPNSQVAWYPSKAIPTVLDRYLRDDPSVAKSFWWCHDLLNPALDLKQAGVDPLAEAIRQCRRRGISPWVSVRMNDPHVHHPYLQCPLHQDPKYRLGELLNYEHREVRDYYFALIRELVNDYDIDGLELDWLRSPTCCRRDASAETIAMMTNWFSEIRKLTQAKAAERGSPLYFGMRIPANYTLLPSIGIDVQGMVQDGMLDFLCPSNFMVTTWDMPHDQLRKVFGDKVAIYGVTELWVNETRLWSETLQLSLENMACASPPALRANAAGKLALGADGIVQYNFFCADQARKFEGYAGPHGQYAALKNLHDLESLRGRTKHYSLCSNLLNYGPGEFDLPKPLPVTLKPGVERAFRLPMCAEPVDRGLKLIVQVVVEKAAADADVAVRFNNSQTHSDGKPTRELLFSVGPANRHLPKYRAYNYRFDVNEIIECWNEIVLANSGNQPARIVSLELAVQRNFIAQE